MSLEQAAELIAGADALLYCAGAGMGVDSGLPDFRGPEGFWRAYPPYRRLGLVFEELADPVHFTTDPELVWGFYGHRLALYRATEPHAGFAALQRLAGERPTQVFTSNVDGQFQRAGFAPSHVLECHGSIHHLQCLNRCSTEIWSADDTDVRIDTDTMHALPPLPSCPRCGELARPNILMFGDYDWLAARTEAAALEHQTWLSRRRDRRETLVVVEIGAGTAVPTVRRHAERIGGDALIRINTREPSTRRGIGIAAPAREALTALETLVSG